MPFLHMLPDVGMNYTFNRPLLDGTSAARLKELSAITPRIKDYDSWYRVWLEVAKKAEADKRWLDAASYYHGAEFYLPAGDVRNGLYDDFARTWALGMKDVAGYERIAIPYPGGNLPGFRLQGKRKERSTLIFTGGYDSFVGEFYNFLLPLTELGITVIAKVGDWVVTPRIGKPVEINALWYNALRIMSAFAERLGKPDSFSAPAEAARRSFARFVRPDGEGLYNVIDGPNGEDASIRPNQIFAASLPYSPLSSDDQARVVRVLQSPSSHRVRFALAGVRQPWIPSGLWRRRPGTRWWLSPGSRLGLAAWTVHPGCVQATQRRRWLCWSL